MKKLIPYLKKTLYLLAVLMLIALLVVLNKKHASEPLKRIVIDIDAPDQRELLSETMLKKNLEKWYPGGLIGLELTEIDINDIESKIRQMPAVENAEVSTGLNGDLYIQVEQVIPVVRIYGNGLSPFYMDTERRKINSSGLDAARVPVATGINGDAMIKKVYTLALSVNENAFMSALTEQIFVSSQGDLTIIPKLHGHQIILGDTMDLENKFSKLEIFYRDGLKNLGWERYRTINLKYKDQVVCN